MIQRRCKSDFLVHFLIDFNMDCIVIADCMVGYFNFIPICVTLLSSFPVAVSTFVTLVVAMLANIDGGFIACGGVAVFSSSCIICVCVCVCGSSCVSCGCICGCVRSCVCSCNCGCVYCISPPDSEAKVEELTKEETT